MWNFKDTGYVHRDREDQSDVCINGTYRVEVGTSN